MSYTPYILPVELYIIMDNVVDSMRDTESINGIIADGVNFKYTASNSLLKNDFISITDFDGVNENQKIITADSTSFTIAKEYTTAYRYKSNAPYFMHEKEAKAAEILTSQEGKGSQVAWQRYPLFLLTRPYTDDRTNQMIGYSVDFNLYLIVDTEQKYRSDDRVDNSFEPTLYPLYQEFMNKLILNRWVKQKFIDKIAHNKTDLMFIGGNPFPDKMDGITIAFNGLEILKNVQVCEPVTPKQYNLTLETDGNGEIQPFEGTEIKNVNEIIAINATNNAGYRFSRWLINGIESVVNPTWVKMTNNISAFAEFVVSLLKQLTISVVSVGTTSPVPGIYEKESGIPVAITAVETNPNLLFKKFTENGVDKFTNPLTVLMLDNTDVVVYFQEYIQDVFGTTPVNQIFEDISGNNNPITYKNVQVGNFTGISERVDCIIPVNNSFTYYFDIIPKEVSVEDIIGTGGANTGNTLNMIFAGKIRMHVWNSAGIRVIDGNTPIVTGQRYRVAVCYNDNDGLNLFINGVFDINHPSNGVFTPTSSSNKLGSRGGSNTPNVYYINYKYFDYDIGAVDAVKITNGEEVAGFKQGFNLQDGEDDLCVDISGQGNHGIVNGAILSDFRGTYIDGIDSVLIKNGYSSLQQIADPTKFIYAAYTDAGLPTQTSIAGYESPIEIPKNVVSDNKITYDGVLGSVSGVANTYAELNALTLPEYEVTKTADYISNLKVVE